MTALLELRENLKKIYSRNEAFILPVIKFLLSFIVLSIINGKMGYMTKRRLGWLFSCCCICCFSDLPRRKHW